MIWPHWSIILEFYAWKRNFISISEMIWPHWSVKEGSEFMIAADSFPYLKWYGPIEAAIASSSRYGNRHISISEMIWPHWSKKIAWVCIETDPEFPYLKWYGPIEAGNVVGIRGYTTLFPYLKWYGPIEALRWLIWPDRPRQNFHIWNDMAPLKTFRPPNLAKHLHYSYKKLPRQGVLLIIPFCNFDYSRKPIRWY